MLTTSIHISEEVIHRLRRIANCKAEPLDRRVGLCANLIEIIGQVLPAFTVDSRFKTSLVRQEYSLLLDKACKTWPHYSGNLGYPVQVQGTNGANMYMTYPDKWDNQTRYGELRLSLTAHFADYLETEFSIHKESRKLTESML